MSVGVVLLLTRTSVLTAHNLPAPERWPRSFLFLFLPLPLPLASLFQKDRTFLCRRSHRTQMGKLHLTAAWACKLLVPQPSVSYFLSDLTPQHSDVQ
jgi:hypothetical protein